MYSHSHHQRVQEQLAALQKRHRKTQFICQQKTTENYYLQKKVDKFESGQIYLELQEEIDKSNRKFERAQIQIETLKKYGQKQNDLAQKYLREKAEQKVAFTERIEALEKENRKCRAEVTRDKSWEKEYDNEKIRTEKYKCLYMESESRNRTIGVQLEELQRKNLLLFAQLNANSTNTGKTTTTDGPRTRSQRRKEKAERARKHGSSRHKTGKKPGAQPGHKGYHRKNRDMEATRVVILPEPAVVAAHPEEWKLLDKQRIHSGIGIIMKVEKTDYVARQWKNKKTGEIAKSFFPTNLNNEINYEPSVEAFNLLMTGYCNVSIRKTQEFLEALSDGRVRVSVGTIQNTRAKFASLSQNDLKQIFTNLATAPYLNVDTTYTRLNGVDAYVHITADPENVLYQARERKGYAAVKGTPLEISEGTLVHDGESVYFNYGKAHQICLVHEERYLRRSMDVEPELKWNKKMYDFLQKLLLEYEEAEGHISEPRRKELEEEYVQILEEGLKEYPEPKKLVWREGYATVRRLLRNKEHALYFLSHEGIPFHNNHAEQMARSFKRKTHQMEQFRSLEGMEIQAAISSILQTTRMRKENIWHKAREILERQTSRQINKRR